MDTGPLLDLLAVQLTEAGVPWRKPPQLHAISTPPLAEQFCGVIRRAPGRVFTTSAVLAEIHRTVRNADHRLLSTFRAAAVETFSRLEIRDRGHRALIEWQPELRACLGRHGPTDVGLLALCVDLAHEYDEAIVVTNESELLTEPARLELRGVTARDPIWLIQEFLGPGASPS